MESLNAGMTRRGLDQGPGDFPAASEDGEDGVLEDSLHSPGQGVDLVGVEEGLELGGEAIGVVEAGQFPGYRGEGVLCDLLTAEVPDHGAELGLDAESQAVVYAPHLATRVLDAVAALSIGVVDHEIKDCNGLHLLGVGVP